MSITKLVSGGQTGADLSGLVVGQRFGFDTGGWMPKGFKTLSGPRPEYKELYGVKEHLSDNYAPRTELNVKESDGTVRLAGVMDSKGEICTLRAIKKFKKPYFDVDLTDPPPIKEFTKWLTDNDISVLNVAGNSEQTFYGAFKQSVSYLTDSFFELGYEMFLSERDILKSLGLSNEYDLFTDKSVQTQVIFIKRKP